MNTDKDSAVLYETLNRVYKNHSDEPFISPAWLATEAMVVIGFPRELHSLGYLGCHLQFRQMARHFCRKHFDPVEPTENDLFPETLQQRYPRRLAAVNEDPEYVLLDLLSDSEIQFNIDRLIREGEAKLKHASALEVWRRRKFHSVA